MCLPRISLHSIEQGTVICVRYDTFIQDTKYLHSFRIE